MKRHGNGLRSIGVLCCLLLLLPSATLSAESNLYQDLMDWSDSFEVKLNSLEQRWNNSEQITLGLLDSLNTIEQSYQALNQNSQEREALLQKQGMRLQTVEQIQRDLQKDSQIFEAFLLDTERTLKKLRLQNTILTGSVITLATAIIIVAVSSIN